ncbi:3-isopropylmalate dehydratase small subunit [Chloroflexota bacterium]
MLKGRGRKFGDNISTDHICPGRYVRLRSNLPELAKYACEDADPNFVNRIQPGDFLVAGKNFGLGSSREHAPLVIKMNGISAILAKSVARIFYRNAFNIGMLVLVCDTDRIEDDDMLEIDLEAGIVKDLTNGQTINFHPVPKLMMGIMKEGGLVPYINKYRDLEL